jgi:hypothetical protein
MRSFGSAQAAADVTADRETISAHLTTNVAILLIVFNRPTETARVMEAIRAAKPSRLYVAADGARDRLGEGELCSQTRQIATNVDWPCELITLFRQQNLGCRLGVSGALNWFFSQEEEGIILEDDCLPSPSFFRFCTELLERYRNDKRIMCISGSNFQAERRLNQYSYYFSRYMHCWGWASWRRAWELYDVEMSSWRGCRKSSLLRALGDLDDGFVEYWTSIFDRVCDGRIDTWDYQWTLTCWMNNGLTCLPGVNLVRNIGFGPGATHTHDATSCFAHLAAHTLEFPLFHPRIIARDVDADSYTHVLMCSKPMESTRMSRLAGVGARLVSIIRKGGFEKEPFWKSHLKKWQGTSAE